ncbi:MAG: GNAT family N-acetyltransferase [Holosporales bacterium]|jgi:ribosomal-protein-alanine N-acetyltransferase|nr:GNAT family N-acetyltransferase [Holosporales bacterium]
MVTTLIIKQILVIDSEELAHVSQIVFLKRNDKPWNKCDFTSILNQRGFGWKYLVNEHIVGYVLAVDLFDYVDLLKLAVLPNYQRQGIATKLLEKMLQLKKRILLDVASDNIGAISLYEKHGFKKIDKRLHYYCYGGCVSDSLIFQYP